MAKRRKEKRFYKYSCTITGESYKLTEHIENTDDLVSVEAYYQLHPDRDDRPLVIKKQLGIEPQE